MRQAIVIAGIVAAIVHFSPAARSSPAPAPTLPGAQLFKQRCQSCHSQSANPMGPNLAGVVGRKAGTAPFRYSPALKAAGITWTRQSLDQFLTSPARMVPGSRMPTAITDPRQRAEIIDYLTTIR